MKTMNETDANCFAVVERADDRPGQPPRTKVVPVGLPRGVEFEAYFSARVVHRARAEKACYSMPQDRVSESGEDFCIGYDQTFFKQMEAASTQVEDILDKLVARIAADGGMPGADKRERLAKSLLALRLLRAAGRGEYKRYERRLLDFAMHCEIGLVPGFATRIEEGLDRINPRLATTVYNQTESEA